MIVADTCVWIEAYIGSPTGARYASLFDTPDLLIVPSLVQFELRRWALREVGEELSDKFVAATRVGRVVDLSEPIAVLGAELAARFQLAAMDALIYASAQYFRAQLATCDAHFDGLPGVNYAPKLA